MNRRDFSKWFLGLLTLPFVAKVVAKAAVTTKIQSGTIVKFKKRYNGEIHFIEAGTITYAISEVFTVNGLNTNSIFWADFNKNCPGWQKNGFVDLDFPASKHTWGTIMVPVDMLEVLS